MAHWPTDLGHQCLEAPEGAVALPARAGSIVVFSSLTPHATGPNTSAGVRKAYIVQFAPEGARALSRDSATGKTRSVAQDAPERQFPVLRAGAPPA
jgi:phytanoyl-CoA hydroxylase